MTLCRVKGTVVSTVKHPTYKGLKLYVVQPVDENGKPVDSSFLAVDQVQSGVGDLVLVVTEGNSARQIFTKDSSHQIMIVWVVDADYHASTVLEAR